VSDTKVVVVGTIGLDTVRTPFGEKQEILGGSAVYASVAASFFSNPFLIGAAGKDFPAAYVDFLKGRGILLDGMQVMDGQTFRWSGYYEYDMNQAHTLDTKLNIYRSFSPSIPDVAKEGSYLFLANLDPELQLKVLDQMVAPKLVIADTMNYWISSKRELLHEVVKRVDFMLMNDSELRQYMETPNVPQAAAKLLAMGAKGVIVKKGEHGALLFSKNIHFSAPSYPQHNFVDPTGAGDSFAGGLIGYLAKTGDLGENNLRKAIIIGSVMASFNVEDFSLGRLKILKQKEVLHRFEEFRRFSAFEALSAAHLS
jgi:ribokinase